MDPAGKVPHMFPDEPLADLGELNAADGWLRATAPSGVASYEGLKMWRDTPGPANWDPEPTQEERDRSTKVRKGSDG
jgi:hypothetical protein